MSQFAAWNNLFERVGVEPFNTRTKDIIHAIFNCLKLNIFLQTSSMYRLIDPNKRK